ncbi:MAG: nucleoside triphosphate pyrophosphohydrolase [Rickettsiales bacterium]|nr:nucleoside triphosphate pyrophosphohydrolase [Rickettsiales bacterium]|tara:strand:+ start:1152 stop:1931 length:780 start_codon:yes stop_codon:yes gene_type:complete
MSNQKAMATAIDQLLEVMQALRTPETGCPWDLEQDFASIRHYALEEAYEVVDAIERNDMRDLKEELGDLLLQVVFHAQMAKEQGLFTFNDVAQGIAAKMIRRHPHVFGETTIIDGQDVHANWEVIKAEERQEKGKDDSLLADIPHAFPSLLRAVKLQKRAAKIGFDWPDTEPVYDKINEEIDEVKTATNQAEREEEIGDLLFVVANLARHFKVDPEAALRAANQKFETRFRHMESQGLNDQMDLEAMEELWQHAKHAEG